MNGLRRADGQVAGQLPTVAAATDPVVAEKLIALGRKGMGIWSAWVSLGMKQATLGSWNHVARYGVWPNGRVPPPETREMIVTIFERYQQALAQFEEEMIEIVNEVARSGRDKENVADWKAAAYRLERGESRRQHFMHHEFPPTEAERRGNKDVPPEYKAVRDLTDAELRELNPKWRELLPPPAGETQEEG